MGVIQRGFKNAFRNSIRTFSIVLILGLSIGLALTMLVARQAVQAKIASVNSSIGNTISISPAGVRGFEGGGNPLTETDLAKITSLAHVTSVVKTLNDRLTPNNTNLVSSIDPGQLAQRFARNDGESSSSAPKFMDNDQSSDSNGTFTMPVTVIGTTSPTDLSGTQGGGTFTLKSGSVFEANSTDNVAVIGSALASKNNLSVGSTFTAYSTSIKVIGIYDAGNDFANAQVIMPLATVQKLSSQMDDVSSATVNVDSIANIDSVTTAVSNSLGSKADVTNAAQRAKEAIAPLQNIESISMVSLIGSLVAGAVIILLTMMMIVRERRREIGVLKALGATNLKVMSQFIVEAMTLTLLGTVLGLVIGVLGSNPVTQFLVQNSSSTGQSAGQFGGRGFGGRMMAFAGQGVNNLRNIQTNVGWNIILYGIGAAIIIAIIGSAIPAFFISRVRPAEVMRAE